ncbi:phenylalanine--tRNA ligase subunit alpha [bacterium]
MDTKKKLEKIFKEAKEKISKTKDIKKLEAIKIEYLGRKSDLLTISKSIKDLSKEEKPIVGKLINEIKSDLENLITDTLEKLGTKSKKDHKSIDVTLPGKAFPKGSIHPLTHVLNEIVDIFNHLGFGIAEGPSIETEDYNFTALNFPAEHPARDEQDTFFLKNPDKDSKERFLLRTHTSPVQIRYMEINKPPFQIIIPGSVYRCDSDVSHTPMFNQVEGLVVGEKISFSDLKSVLTYFVHEMFGQKTKLRFRPSFFPFTEPSAEIDISCVICKGKGCRLCKDSGWLEILGAGMVHPNVFKSVNYDNEKYTGYAFGMGIERVALLKFGIDDLRFLKQF